MRIQHESATLVIPQMALYNISVAIPKANTAPINSTVPNIALISMAIATLGNLTIH